MTKYLAAALTALVLALGASPAYGDEPAPTEPVPTEPTPEPTPEPEVPAEPEPEAPVVVDPGYGAVDVLQPPTAVRVLPRACVASGAMPAVARACRVTNYGKRRPMVVVWGDSHSWQQTPALIAQARKTRTNLVTFQMGACPPMIVAGRSECAKVGQRAIAFIKARSQRGKATTVVLGGAWALYGGINAGTITGTPYLAQQARLWRTGTPAAFRALDRLARVRTVGIAQMPMVPLGACIRAYACDLPRAVAVPNEAAYDRWLAGNVDRVVDAVGYVCSTSTCAATRGGVPTYLDVLHLNPALAPAFAPAYRTVFAR